MHLKERKLNARIHDFMDRKAIEYPELHLMEDHKQTYLEIRPNLIHGRIADIF